MKAALHCLALPLLLAFSLVSCSDTRVSVPSIDATPILSGGLGWGVVVVAYTRVGSQPLVDAEQAAFARRGDLLELVGRERRHENPGKGIWYKVKIQDTEGWIHESALGIYPSKLQAQNAPEAGK